MTFNKIKLILDVFFAILFLCIPLIDEILLKFSYSKMISISVLTLCFWCIIHIVFFKIKPRVINVIDVSVFFLILYIVYIFIFDLSFSLFFYKKWIYLSFGLIYFLFRNIVFFSNDKKNNFINCLLYVVLFICVLQSFLGLLQYFKVIEANHNYYDLLGTFVNPNLFAFFLNFGFLTAIWFFFIKINRLKKIHIYYFTLIFSILLLTIFFTSSRTSWVSLGISLSILVISSSKFLIFFKLLHSFKKTVIIFFFVLLIIPVLFFLCKLNPDSVEGRLLTYKISLNKIAEKPILGYGMFSFVYQYNKAKCHYFSSKKRSWNEIKNGGYISLPNNDYILIAFELGILFLFSLIFLLFFVLKNLKINLYTRLGLAFVTNVCVIALFSSPVNSLYIVFLSILGFILLMIDSNNTLILNKRITSYYYNTQNYFILILCVTISYLVFYKLYNMDKVMQFDLNKSNVMSFINKSKSIEDNFFSDHYIGLKIYNKGCQELGLDFIEKSYRKNMLPSTGRRLVSIYLNIGDQKKAEEILKNNINIEPYRFEPKYKLLKFYKKNDSIKKGIEVAKDIIVLKSKIPSSKVTFYKQKAELYLNENN